jgi:bifunctional non-homologous end joining protein LigD
VSDLLQRVTPDERDLITEGPPPRGSQAMKATLTQERFSDPDWIFERKLDGIRAISVRSGPDDVSLWSRNDLSLNRRYPELASALGGIADVPFATDGEIVAFDGAATSFARLAQRAHTHVAVFYYIFDLLWFDGHDLRALPLRTRKRLLRAVLNLSDPIRLTTYRNQAGEALYDEACRKGWEGVIAKRAGSPYGERRSRDWLKFKCEQGQELVIGGYTAPRGSRTEFGALLLGYYDGDALRYAGKVGTGFARATLNAIAGELRRRAIAQSPFADTAQIRERGVAWVAPELVAQVAFTEWTGAGRLRHPRFLGLRDDKPAAEVVRER